MFTLGTLGARTRPCLVGKMNAHRWEPVTKPKAKRLVFVSMRSGPYVARVEFRCSARSGTVEVGRLTTAVELPVQVEREFRQAAAKYLTRNLEGLQLALRA